jgi:hypothetical protein
MNISLNISEKIVTGYGFEDFQSLLPHERVVEDRQQKLCEYLKSLRPYLIIPSILICDKSKMIVDGHHRYYALIEMGYSKIPVTYINYNSKLITTHIEHDISKETLLDAAIRRSPLEPKSSFHHVLDLDYRLQPIILLSSLVRLDQL